MRNENIKLSLICILLICAFALVSCSKSNKFAMSDGMYLDKKTDIKYIDASPSYEPIVMGSELYGTIGSAEIYEVEGADPAHLLCESGGTVIYAESFELPTFEKMNISYVAVLEDDTEISKITDSALISELVDVYSLEKSIRKPNYSKDTLSKSFRLKFADEALGLYYVLNYIELKEDYVTENENGDKINYGRAFIFNRFEDKCVPANDVLKSINND